MECIDSQADFVRLYYSNSREKNSRGCSPLEDVKLNPTLSS